MTCAHSDKGSKVGLNFKGPAFIFLLFLVSFLGLNACSKNDDEPKDPSQNNLGESQTGQLQLGVVASNYQKPSASLQLSGDTQMAGPPFRATSILSGAPQSFTIYVKSISLQGEGPEGPDGAKTQLMVKVFEDKEGKPISIDGSNVDLSGLFITPSCIKADGTPVALPAGKKCECGLDAQGNLVQKTEVLNNETQQMELKCNYAEVTDPPVGVVDVSVGKFTNLSVTYSSKASIKGCLTGYFRTNAKGVGDTSVSHTYCTRQEGSLFTGSAAVSLATFEDKKAEVMDTALSGVGGPNTFTADSGDTMVNYPIDGGFQIEQGKSSRLTLLIDTNRILRFEAANRDDAVILKPGWPKSRPYFFSTIFADSSFVFIGKPGSIKGYSWKAYSCRTTSSPCKGTDNAVYIEGWLTSIFDTKGAPMIMSYMPDDDSTLTVIKGSNFIVSQDPQKGLVRTIDPESYFKDAAGKVTLKYRLDKDTGTISLPEDFGTLNTTVEGTFSGFQQYSGEFAITRKL